MLDGCRVNSGPRQFAGFRPSYSGHLMGHLAGDESVGIGRSLARECSLGSVCKMADVLLVVIVSHVARAIGNGVGIDTRLNDAGLLPEIKQEALSYKAKSGSVLMC